MHDTINPLLSAAKLIVESLREECESAGKEQLVNLNNVVNLLERSMKEIKEISSNLMPSVLKDFGLPYALNELCTKISESGKLPVNLDIHGITIRFSREIEVNLYRIAVELLNNIIKHAHATKAEIQLIRHKNKNLIVMVMVDDDGKGLKQPFEKMLHTGYGFQNVQSRVKLLNGKMEVDSAKGRGTTIIIEIPFESK